MFLVLCTHREVEVWWPQWVHGVTQRAHTWTGSLTVTLQYKVTPGFREALLSPHASFHLVPTANNVRDLQALASDFCLCQWLPQLT